MRDLEDKLRKILLVQPTDRRASAIELTIAQLKKAFNEAYWLMPKYPNSYPDPLVMTGQDWYDRFRHELGLSAVTKTEVVLKAAKKAAGLK